MLLGILGVLEILWVIGITVWILLERRSAAAAMAWILALALLPGFGIFVYYFLGPRRLARRRARHWLAKEAVAAWTAKSRSALAPGPLHDARQRRIARVGEVLGEAPALRVREVDLFFDGDACFERLLRDIAAATHHVHLEYYIFQRGKLAARLREILIERARAGVEVRLLLDAVGSKGLSRRFLRPLEDAGAEVAWFHPLRLARLRPRLLNFRNHRKIAVIDGRTAWTGGMNVMDANLKSLKGDRAWRDTHLRIHGLAAVPLQLLFLEDWQDATDGAPEDERYLDLSSAPTAGAPVQVLASGPDQSVYPIHEALFALLGEARERVFATTPYFVPDESIISALGAAALRGVDVRVLIPRSSDMIWADAAGRSYQEDLLGRGVKLYLYDPGMIHAKTLVVDQDLAMVGTANLDNRSFRLNFEVVVLLYDRDLNDRLARRFLADLERSTELADVSQRGFPARLFEGVARLFSPLL